MKKTFIGALMSALLVLCAVSFTACSDDAEEINFYSITISSTQMSGSGGSGDILTNYYNDLSAIEAAFKAEFGELSFNKNGDTAANDKDAVARFNKVVSSVQLNGGWSGYVVYDLVRTASSGGTESLASHKFESLQ